MKIRRIETIVAKAPLGADRFYSSQAAFPERVSLLVRIESDGGIVGWGEGGQYGPAEPVASVIESVFAPMLLGGDPRVPTVVWEALYAASRDFGQKGTYVEAISAIDIALWDILGQAAGLPVHTLLGGAFRDSVQAYATGCYYKGSGAFDGTAALAALQDEARSYVGQGFRILKTKIGLISVEADLARLAAIREAVGPEVVLLTDANHAYNAATAIRAGRGLERLDIRWFEEPVPPEDRDGYRRVRAALDIPIAGGECEFTRFGFRDLLGGGCVDIAQPDTCAAGGFSEMQKIQALAAAHGVMVCPHVWGSGIAVAAALHVLATTPWAPYSFQRVALQNEPVVEFDRNPNPMRDDILEEPFRLDDKGRLAVPDGPGLGVRVIEERLAPFVVRRRELTV